MERLQKALAAAGVASRRKAEELIAAGRVKVDGAVITTPGTLVDASASDILVDNVPISTPKIRYYVALNKPVGVVSTVDDPHAERKVVDLVKIPGARLVPCGRLDADSEGLILLSDDGDFVFRVTHPSVSLGKMYHVTVAGAPTDESLIKIERGLLLPGETRATAPARVKRLGKPAKGRTLVEITLHEGRNRQIRRMMETLGHPVERLVRIRVGPVYLGDLPEGEWRPLTESEIRAIVAPAPPSGRPSELGVGRSMGRGGRDEGRTTNFRGGNDGPPRRFDGPRPPRPGFDGPRPQRQFDAPRQFDRPRSFDGPPREPRQFDGPRGADGPRNFDGPRPPRRDFDGPPRRNVDGPPRQFDGPRPPRQFDGPRNFDGPRPPRPGFDGPRPQRQFDGPPRESRGFDGPRSPRDFGAPRPQGGPRSFDGPSAQNRNGFDGPPRRFDGPRPPRPGFDGPRPPRPGFDGPRNFDGPRPPRPNAQYPTPNTQSGFARPDGQRIQSRGPRDFGPGGSQSGGNRPSGDRPYGDRSGGNRPPQSRPPYSGGDRPRPYGGPQNGNFQSHRPSSAMPPRRPKKG